MPTPIFRSFLLFFKHHIICPLYFQIKHLVNWFKLVFKQKSCLLPQKPYKFYKTNENIKYLCYIDLISHAAQFRVSSWEIQLLIFKTDAGEQYLVRECLYPQIAHSHICNLLLCLKLKGYLFTTNKCKSNTQLPRFNVQRKTSMRLPPWITQQDIRPCHFHLEFTATYLQVFTFSHHLSLKKF